MIISASVFAQVAINADGSGPDPSAMLDVKSTDRGFLPPRMTTEQMNSIVTPLEGLLVYNTSVNSLYWFNGTTWKRFNEFSYTETDPVFAIHPASGITSWNITSWNTAYGWGNHATAGYLTSYTETDPIFGAHPAFGITNANISAWNIAYSNRITGASGTAPLSLSIAGNLLTGSMTAANSTTNGYLTSIDWNTFNSKQNALILGSVSSTDMAITGGTNAVIGSGLNLTITKGSLTSADLTVTGGSNAVLGSGTTLTIKKGNLTEATSSVLTITGGTNAALGTGTTIQVKQATTSQSGYLSNTDWNTFNNKQNTLIFGNLTSNDITVTGGGTAVKGGGTTLAINKGNLAETGSSVLTISNGSNAVLGSGSTIQVKQANASQSGYLSTADWNSFNNKISSQWTANGLNLHYNTGNVGIGTSNPLSRVDIAGNAVIGSAYSGNNAAPSNGLLIEGQVGIGTSSPSASAALEISSTNSGILIPRMTNAQRNAISSPSDGLMVMCTNCGFGGGAELTFYSSGSWYTIPKQPQWTCGMPITKNHTAGDVSPVTKTTTYGTVTGIPGEAAKCWITSNLGSDHQATAVNDATEASSGWYWQCNRKQGYKHDGTNRIPNTTWISSISESSDWLTANDPCNLELGTSWRIPTYTEWFNVDNTGGWTNWNGPWGSGLKLHAAGYLRNSDGTLSERGLNGHYWSSTQYSSTACWPLHFDLTVSYTGAAVKAYGYSLRCLRD